MISKIRRFLSPRPGCLGQTGSALVMGVALLLISVGAWAEIYRTVDENGNVVFSDQPLSDSSEAMDLPPLSIMEPTPIAPRTPAVEAEPETPRYDDLSFVAPAQDETLWGTAATVAVQLSASQRLQRGHQVVITLNGDEVFRGRSMSATLTGIERGEHQLAAQIVDQGGNALGSAGPVTIHMKQQSAQNPNNPANRPIPSPAGG